MVVALIGLLGLSGCSRDSRSPDAIRQNTANATAAAARDAKAIAQGVFDGLKTKGPININRATEQELETLPGIDSAAAKRIIADRPYGSSMELSRRHVITKAEYDRIATRIKTR